MPHTFTQKKCDLTRYPARVSVPVNDHDNDEVTAGDMHGNALYLMHFLIKYHVIELDKASYSQFVDIYQKPVSELTKADFDSFDTLLGKATLNNNKKVRLLGDILADRGKNDYFTLKLIELLDKGGADLSILLSNHDAEFMLNFELNEGLKGPFKEKMMDRRFTHSIEGMVNSIEAGHLDRETCEALYRKHYLPHVKAIDYCFDNTVEPTIPLLFTHAPIDLRLMGEVANELGLPFDTASNESVKTSIDNINEKMRDILLKGEFHQVFEEMITVDYETREGVIAFFNWGTTDKEQITNERINASIKALQSPHKERFAKKFPGIARRGHVGIDIATKEARALTRLIWNRDFSDLTFTPPQRYWYVHGHDSQIIPGNISTLDGLLGKDDKHMKAPMPVMASTFELPTHFHYIDYKIELIGSQRVLEINSIDKRNRFRLTQYSEKIRLGVTDGLSNKDIISRLNAMFTYKDGIKKDGQTKESLLTELRVVLSWPRPEGTTSEEIYERLRKVYELNNQPSSKEIARVFNFNDITDVEFYVKKEDPRKPLLGEDPDKPLLEVKGIKMEAKKEVLVDTFVIPVDPSITQEEAGRRLQAVFNGRALRPTKAAIMAEFSSVFKPPKLKGTRLKGKVEAKADTPIPEILEEIPASLKP